MTKNNEDKNKIYNETPIKEKQEFKSLAEDTAEKLKTIVFQSDDYFKIKQDTPTNLLRRSITGGTNDHVDDITGKAIIHVDNLKVFIETHNATNIKISPLDHLVLDILVSKYVQGNKSDNGVYLDLDEFIELRGGTMDKKTARSLINRSLNNLYSLSLEFTPVNSKYEYISTRVLSSKGIANKGKSFIKNNIIYAGFAPEFLKIIDRGYSTLLPKSALRVNFKYNPNTYHLATALAIHKRSNMGKPNENKMKVQTLLERCPNLPTYDFVMNGNRNVRDRIISRFLRDLGEITEISYDFINSEGSIVDHADVEFLPYLDFIDLTLIITGWRNFPNEEEYQENAIKKRKKYSSIAEKKKGGS